MSKRQWFAFITIIALIANPVIGVGLIALALTFMGILAILVGLGSLWSDNY